MTTESVSTEGAKHSGHEDHREHSLDLVDLARIAFVGLSAFAVWSRAWEPFPKVSVIAVLATLVGGWPIYREAMDNLLARLLPRTPSTGQQW